MSKFAKVWNSSASLDEFLEKYPKEIKRSSAYSIASRLRKQGEELKYFNPRYREREHEKKDAFIYLWNSCASLDEFLEKYPGNIRNDSARSRASLLRREGHELQYWRDADNLPIAKLRDWYTAAEAREMFGWTSRAIVSQTASREKWTSGKIGGSKLYWRIDVDDYWFARQRRELAKRVDWLNPGSTLIRHDDWDMDCPKCGAFAIGHYGNNWVCVRGHAENKDNE